jgi:hypothetical protein
MSGPETTWPRRGLFHGGRNRIGGNGKLASSGDQLRAQLGGLVLDYPTDPSVCSIYSVLERWHVNLGWRGGDRRRKESQAHEISGFHRGGSPAITEHA